MPRKTLLQEQIPHTLPPILHSDPRSPAPGGFLKYLQKVTSKQRCTTSSRPQRGFHLLAVSLQKDFAPALQAGAAWKGTLGHR